MIFPSIDDCKELVASWLGNVIAIGIVTWFALLPMLVLIWAWKHL
jgi:hypothetical protein